MKWGELSRLRISGQDVRSIVGSFHQVSCKHLPAYLDEFEFRFNNRDNPYIFRDAIKELLTAGNVEYKELVSLFLFNLTKNHHQLRNTDVPKLPPV